MSEKELFSLYLYIVFNVVQGWSKSLAMSKMYQLDHKIRKCDGSLHYK